MALLSPAEPVSVTVAEMFDDPPTAKVEGTGVAAEVNVSDELTVMVPADAFQFHSCQVELKTPISTVYAPATAGCRLSV